MIAFFKSLKAFIVKNDAVTDNHIFRLHYQFTTLVITVFCVLTYTKQFIDDPISCYTTGDKIPTKVLDAFCLIHSTFTIPSSSPESSHVLAPGSQIPDDESDKKYHKYYQWVSLYLLFQVAVFYGPRYVWKHIENDKLRMLRMDMQCPVHSDKDYEKEMRNLVRYVLKTRTQHKGYVIGYFGCEVLAFLTVISQILMTDYFLDWEFSTYGPKVLKFMQMEQEERHDPMILVFPRVTSCTFKQFGASGRLENHEALCVLPINIVNEKIFVFLWFWFVILAVVTGLLLLYRIPICMSQHFRTWVFVRSTRNTAESKKLYEIVDCCDLGDWFLLKKLAANVDAFNFKDFIDELYIAFVEDGVIRKSVIEKGLLRKDKKDAIEQGRYAWRNFLNDDSTPTAPKEKIDV